MFFAQKQAVKNKVAHRFSILTISKPDGASFKYSDLSLIKPNQNRTSTLAWMAHPFSPWPFFPGSYEI